jgi:uncharacterized zinc-type alcohol dehydrogenase-like protein
VAEVSFRPSGEDCSEFASQSRQNRRFEPIVLLRLDGTMTLVGAPPKPSAVASFSLIVKRRQLAGSSIGGIRETQEMLDFCAEKGITANIELIRIQQINEAYEGC